MKKGKTTAKKPADAGFFVWRRLQKKNRRHRLSGRAFDLFYRGSTGEAIEGTGVGLATGQKIARLYGGLAWGDETPGGGTFWVEVVAEVLHDAGSTG